MWNSNQTRSWNTGASKDLLYSVYQLTSKVQLLGIKWVTILNSSLHLPAVVVRAYTGYQCRTYFRNGSQGSLQSWYVTNRISFYDNLMQTFMWDIIQILIPSFWLILANDTYKMSEVPYKVEKSYGSFIMLMHSLVLYRVWLIWVIFRQDLIFVDNHIEFRYHYLYSFIYYYLILRS